MNRTIAEFCTGSISTAEIKGKNILDIGSLDVNGSMRATCEEAKCKSYLGIDVCEGKSVDRVTDTKALVKEGLVFDVILCMDVLEHCDCWWELIDDLPKLIKDGGRIVLTTVGEGFPFHPYENDYWRFTLNFMQTIFGCMVVEPGDNTGYNRIVQTERGINQMISIMFDAEVFEKRKPILDFMLKNKAVYNMLLGRFTSPQEWIKTKD